VGRDIFVWSSHAKLLYWSYLAYFICSCIARKWKWPMAPPHGMGAHEGEAIGTRECVHRRVACGGGGGRLGGRRVLVRVWLHSIFHDLCVHVASCGRAREATRERVPVPRPLTAPPNATCCLGCVRLAHTAAQGNCRASLGSLGISRCHVDVGLHALLLLPRTMMHD
jgi:hypothetical protein